MDSLICMVVPVHVAACRVSEREQAGRPMRCNQIHSWHAVADPQQRQHGNTLPIPTRRHPHVHTHVMMTLALPFRAFFTVACTVPTPPAPPEALGGK